MDIGTIIPFYSHTKGNYKCFSQFYPCSFRIQDNTFCCAEQWMMYSKACLFPGNDDIANKILLLKDPSKIKKLGRDVKGFVDHVWHQERERIVYQGNLAKFSQNPALAKVLLDTGNGVLVEASPDDRIWGVGLAMTDPDIKDASKWRGLNLLGQALMKVREQLNQSPGISY